MKVIVAHPAQQHSFRLATALKRAGILEKYMTTVYLRDRSWTSLTVHFLNRKYKNRAQGRRCEELKDEDIIQYCEIEGLFTLLAQNIPMFSRYHTWLRYHTADRFAKKVAKYAIRHKVDAVVTYDDCSPVLFEIIKKKAPQIKCILDTSAANRLFMRTIYDKDTELAPSFSARLHKECEQVWKPELVQRTEREIRASDYFLIPSEFVAKSLVYSGVRKEQMRICPYGVDVSQFSQKEYISGKINTPLRFIYVGGVKELKGIYYLLEAFQKIPKDKAVLTVVGGGMSGSDDIKPYLGYVRFVDRVQHSEISNILRNSDVFVFSSLGDSMALSVLEAAACGLPVIITENTGACDCIKDGWEGFIIPIQSSDAIYDKVNWFIKHPADIEVMGKRARRTAEQFTWEQYYLRAKEIFLKLL